MGKHRDINFCGQVGYIKSQPKDDKPSLKGSCSRHVTNFKFRGPNYNAGMTGVVELCTLVGRSKLVVLGCQPTP